MGTKMYNDELIKKAIQLRSVEQTLLDQFNLGRIGGTVHTSIGQEITPIILNKFISKNDWVFSNHRGHSHFLAQHNLIAEVIAEIMGKKTGLCGGYGGSQHLQHEKFYSNGIQGGMTPIACGAAYSEKMCNENNIAVVFIGDGTLGQGVLYEALNIAGWLKLPILFVLEDNGIAQSTLTTSFNYSDLNSRVLGFNLDYFETCTDDWNGLEQVLGDAVKDVRQNKPSFVRIKSRRLMSHSKGDDNRDEIIRDSNFANDPLNKILEDSQNYRDFQSECKQELVSLCDKIFLDEVLESVDINSNFSKGFSALEKHVIDTKSTVREKINASIRNTLVSHPEAIVIGEDIRNRSIGANKDYGGAFKITGNISDDFGERVINFPIAEQAIVGFSIGYALSGTPVICEIMFGDFSTLIIDQVWQHAAKFTKMYGHKVHLPLIIRTPMGGGRGYGPTHSQSLEKLFLGLDGLKVVSMNAFMDTDSLYETIFNEGDPCIIFEHKTGYNSKAKLLSASEIYRTKEQIPTFFVSNSVRPDITFVAHGANFDIVLDALQHANNLDYEIICPSLLSALNIDLVLRSVSKSKKLIFVEEGSISGSIGSSLVTELVKFGVKIDYFDYITNETMIPASPVAEKSILPSKQKILESIHNGMNYDY